MGRSAAPKAKARKRRKNKSAKPVRRVLTITAVLGLVVCLITAAGLLAQRFFKQPLPKVVATFLPVPATVPVNASIDRQAPVYEAFHLEAVPPPPPIVLTRPVTNGIFVAIIIDDIGYDLKMAEGFLALDVPLTFSLLPQGPFNRHIIGQARKQGVELMLHLPMEPNTYPDVNPGPGALLTSMRHDDLIALLNANLDGIPHIKGVNNHMGSKLTASSEHMSWIFSILKKRDLFFVDSRTTADSQCRASAELLRLPFAERDVFIDHLQTDDFIRKQLRVLIRRAQRQGYAIGIAHPHPVTLKVLAEMLPELQALVSLTHASHVVALQQS